MECKAAQERIAEDFCPDCKWADGKGVCTHFLFENAVCGNFEYKSQKVKEEYEAGVRKRQAQTRLLVKGTTVEEIWVLSDEELLERAYGKPIKTSHPRVRKSVKNSAEKAEKSAKKSHEKAGKGET